MRGSALFSESKIRWYRKMVHQNFHFLPHEYLVLLVSVLRFVKELKMSHKLLHLIRIGPAVFISILMLIVLSISAKLRRMAVTSSL